MSTLVTLFNFLPGLSAAALQASFECAASTRHRQRWTGYPCRG